MIPSILILLENGLNEFYFLFTNSNGDISPSAVTGGNLINLAAVEKTKRKNIAEPQYYIGMSHREIHHNLFITLLFGSKPISVLAIQTVL